jgi:hypothetical protein
MVLAFLRDIYTQCRNTQHNLTFFIDDSDLVIFVCPIYPNKMHLNLHIAAYLWWLSQRVYSTHIFVMALAAHHLYDGSGTHCLVGEQFFRGLQET